MCTNIHCIQFSTKKLFSSCEDEKTMIDSLHIGVLFIIVHCTVLYTQKLFLAAVDSTLIFSVFMSLANSFFYLYCTHTNNCCFPGSGRLGPP
jgi:hypothetical protein